MRESGGRKRNRMKYPNVICGSCNNAATSDFDRAYDQVSDWLATQQANYAIAEIDFRAVFGTDFAAGIDAFRRYCIKSLGCKIRAEGCILPDTFPNPVSEPDASGLKLSICRAQPFRDFENYQPVMMERVLSKGSLFANISRSHLEKTGERKILDAVWWENLGHFQINYWFNIQANPALGGTIDSSSSIYPLVHTDHTLLQMKETMASWSENVGR